MGQCKDANIIFIRSKCKGLAYWYVCVVARWVPAERQRTDITQDENPGIYGTGVDKVTQQTCQQFIYQQSVSYLGSRPCLHQMTTQQNNLTTTGDGGQNLNLIKSHLQKYPRSYSHKTKCGICNLVWTSLYCYCYYVSICLKDPAKHTCSCKRDLNLYGVGVEWSCVYMI